MSANPRGGLWANPTRIVVMSFALVIIFGTALLMLPVSTSRGQSPSLMEAAFTATSATCVTGLVVVNTASFWSVWGKIVILLLIQVGGLGLMTFATAHALVVGRRIGLRERMLIQEQTGIWSLSGVVMLMKRIIVATFAFEALGAVILGVTFGITRGLSWAQSAFYGVFHSVSAFCNAGFDIIGSSLVDYVDNATVILTVGMLIILGGLGFHVMVDLYQTRGRWSDLKLHSRMVLKATAVLIALGTFLTLAMEWGNPGTLGNLSLKGKLLASWFGAVTPRTAGFNSYPVGNLLPSSAFMTIILMFIGASPGGTGGGVKTTTFAAAIKSVTNTVRGQGDVNFGKRRIPAGIAQKAIAIISLALVLVILVTLVLSWTEEADFLDILFEVVSAFGTVGLSRGITPWLSGVGKILLMGVMFAGRVGPLSLAMALSGAPKPSGIRFPEERITVG